MLKGIFMTLVIKNGILIDGIHRLPVDNAIVIIEENKIMYAGKEKDFNQSFRSDAEIIDADGKTLLPVLLMHMYTMEVPGEYKLQKNTLHKK